MCLSKLYTEPCKKRIGYKWLKSIGSDRFETGITESAKALILEKGIYATEKSGNHINPNNGIKYRSGFHISTDIRSAYKFRKRNRDGLVLCKVAFKGIITWGEVFWYGPFGIKVATQPTIVAKSVKVLEVVG